MEGKKSNKRRSHRRKPRQDRFINIAEARREIAHFLHLHRSPTSTTEGNINLISNIVSVSESESSHPPHQVVVPLICCYPPLIESLPLPGPTWSTTAPSVLAPPLPPPPPETLEFLDCHENLSSSYNWWSDFLNTLDCKRKTDEVSKFPPAFEEIRGRNGKGVVLGQWQFNVGDHHSSSLHGNDHDDQISSCLDDWFTFPSSEDQGELLF